MKQVIFLDFDGTLVDTLPLLYGIYCKFLQGYGLEGSREEFALLNGRKLEEAVLYLMEKYDLPLDPKTSFHVYAEILSLEYMKKASLFDGVLLFLSATKKAGYRLAIVTAAHRDIVEGILNRLDIAHYFESVVTLEGIDHGKPDPGIYIKALKELDVCPDEALAIEDSKNGLESARGAGIETLHFGTENSWQQILQKVLYAENLSR